MLYLYMLLPTKRRGLLIYLRTLSDDTATKERHFPIHLDTKNLIMTFDNVRTFVG
jgi:hypothetical protein